MVLPLAGSGGGFLLLLSYGSLCLLVSPIFKMAEFLAFIWFIFFRVSLVVMISKLLHVRLDLFKHFRILFCVIY